MSRWKCIDNALYLRDDVDTELWSIPEDAPTIEIIHCRECKKAHLTADGTCKYCDEWKDDDGNYIEVYHDGDHFCGYGKRSSE